jgi:hypothetical protein
VAGAVAVSGQVPNGSGSGGWLREIGEIRVWSLLLLELQLPRHGFRESRECFPGGGTDPRDWRDPRFGFCCWNSNCHDADSADGSGSGGWLREIGKIRRLGFF